MRLGHAGGRYPSDATTAQRQLADVLMSLCRCMEPRSQTERAQKIWISKPALSLYVNARRVPSIAVLRLMYASAEEGGQEQIPCSWEELTALRALAKSGSRSAHARHGEDSGRDGNPDRSGADRSGADRSKSAAGRQQKTCSW
jgi:hypothetical protein